MVATLLENGVILAYLIFCKRTDTDVWLPTRGTEWAEEEELENTLVFDVNDSDPEMENIEIIDHFEFEIPDPGPSSASSPEEQN